MLVARILTLFRIPFSDRGSSPGQHRILYNCTEKSCVEKKEGNFMISWSFFDA